jgi:hypothetical protein
MQQLANVHKRKRPGRIIGCDPAISIEIEFTLDRARGAIKPSQILSGLFQDSVRQICLARLSYAIFGSVHVVDLLVHWFLKFSKVGISENSRFFVWLDVCGRIETEQENHQDEEDWRQVHGRKIAKARIASRTPSKGLVTANQNEAFRPDSWVIELVFTLFPKTFEDRHFRKFRIFLSSEVRARAWQTAGSLKPPSSSLI